jgi:hypothetical protein
MRLKAYIFAIAVLIILSINQIFAQKAKIAVFDIDAIDGKHTLEYQIFSNELSTSDYFDILNGEQTDKVLERQNVRIKSPYELGRLLAVQKLIVFSIARDDSSVTCYISGLDVEYGKKIFDDSIRARADQQISLALKMCARRSGYILNGIDITDEIEQQLQQEIEKEKQSIEEFNKKLAESKKFYRPYKLPAFAAMAVGSGMLIAGLVLDGKAVDAINKRNSLYDEYCTATAGIEDIWNSAINYQEEAKKYITKRNYAYISSAVFFTGGAYLYIIKRKLEKTKVALGYNNFSIVYTF